jgi:hypothetical protein
MFTVELRVNGTMVSHIYGRNIAPACSGKHRYEYEYYEIERRQTHRGVVEHRRESGIRALIASILEDIPGDE